VESLDEAFGSCAREAGTVVTARMRGVDAVIAAPALNTPD
jgi:hypothetical protein